MSKLFVGFNFSTESILSRKITGFRKRFDPKYNQYSFPHMAMHAPFDVQDNLVENLVETLKEELETFYYGSESAPNLGVTGLGVHKHKKKNILYLNTLLETNLGYCSEIVMDICKDHFSPQYKYVQNSRQFLPLGYFQNLLELNVVMEQASMEFTNFSQLPICNISLYQKKFGIWTRVEKLISFNQKESEFLQLNHISV